MKTYLLAKDHVMKTYWGVKVQLHAFLTKLHYTTRILKLTFA